MAAGDEVHIFAKLVAQPDRIDEVRAGLVELVAAIKQEPGVVHYQLHEDTKQPGSFFFFEAYADQAAADAHMKSPNLAKTFAVVGKLMAEPISINITKLLAG